MGIFGSSCKKFATKEYGVSDVLCPTPSVIAPCLIRLYTYLMKTFLSIILIIVVAGLIGLLVRSGRQSVAPETTLLQSCPDEMIINNMPGPGEQKTAYYVVKGERKEIAEYDAAWVTANCNVPTQAVY